MQYVDVCGLQLSKLGLGSPKPLRHGAFDDQYSHLVDEALHGGVNFFDTAPAYGTEHNLARMLNRNDVFISTKSPHRLGVRQGWKTVTKRMTKQLDESLKTLRTDYVDFYFLHAISPNMYDRTLITVASTLKTFQKQGKVRFIGISEDVPHDPNHLMIGKANDSMLFNVVMQAATGLVPTSKPTFGMLVNGPVTKAHLNRFAVTLTGTSQIGHLLANIDACR